MKSEPGERSREAIIARYAVLTVMAAIILGPIAVAALSGFKTTGQVRANPFSIPSSPIWSNYSDVLQDRSFWRMTGNSLLITIATTILVVAMASSAAFVFSRFRSARPAWDAGECAVSGIGEPAAEVEDAGAKVGEVTIVEVGRV